MYKWLIANGTSACLIEAGVLQMKFFCNRMCPCINLVQYLITKLSQHAKLDYYCEKPGGIRIAKQ